jgi:hypothetical protein
MSVKARRVYATLRTCRHWCAPILTGAHDSSFWYMAKTNVAIPLALDNFAHAYQKIQ